jgi:GTP cyclohydrolase II
MSTKWGMIEAIAFERDVSNGTTRFETALAIIMGDLTERAPLPRIHSQCFTGEILGSLRCAARALQASKRLLKRAFGEQIKAAMEVENQEFSALVGSEEARLALGAFLEKYSLPVEAVQ